MASLSSISELMKIEVDKDINGDVDHNFFDEDSSHIFSSAHLSKQASTDKEYNYVDDFEDDDSETDEELSNAEITECFAADNAPLLSDSEVKSNFYCDGESFIPVEQENVETVLKDECYMNDATLSDIIEDSEINRIIENIENVAKNKSDDLHKSNDFTELNFNDVENKFKQKLNINDDFDQCKNGFSNKMTHSDPNVKTVLGDSDNKNTLFKKKIYRDLMNTIAFDHIENSKTKDLSKEASIERSVSSDTTSDITDVTPCPSTSGCFSISQCEMQDESSVKKLKTKKGHKREAKHPPPPQSSSAPLKFLADVVDSMENHNHGTVKTGVTVCGSKKQGRLNMSFSNEKAKKIDRDNAVLSKKILKYEKPHRGIVIPPYQSRLSSSAINRRRECERIEHDNMILINKLQKVKGVVNSGIRRL